MGKFRQSLEDLIYKKVIRSLMLTSKLGRQCVLGEASTGYNFDHMYSNKAEGQSGIGRIVDSILLNLPSVKATRKRKETIVQILKDEIDNLRKKDKKVRLMDVACGAGRYLTEINTLFKDQELETIGVDYDNKSINLGKVIAEKVGLVETSLRFIKGNVFKLGRLKGLGNKIDWKPHIILASGLIVYLDDETTKNVLKQAYEGLEENGLFIFSSQQSNPSKKLMEKVCTTDKGAWILYYRQPDTVTNWLAKAGFKKVTVTTDKWKMYNLFTARK